ncbi:hypothetical protein VCRA2116O30_90183 [Vibrio crassostreae]|uniref:Uncharacterized protein n=1 Tax=Vibrio crassostreae TaxID=246167 RepID=A0ABM9QNB6_9VIBR|nr:hypothetical protein VCRA2117O37_100174 [Vibrio crassostreae]CAK1711586.1 hypothetical protein VCRA2116O31_100182 [Vibrio crassostreae]CAK2225734.1 hypothetical protein VCRA2119O46_70064 [Vibrio crassostreae]CAK2226561.1 hypothetical protein VCRA2116O28_70063 [Vibrio crassostreae]CAK2226838.1 hypothetical protein VCRA2119O44_70064 [Vibrio crassostreae]
MYFPSPMSSKIGHVLLNIKNKRDNNITIEALSTNALPFSSLFSAIGIVTDNRKLDIETKHDATPKNRVASAKSSGLYILAKIGIKITIKIWEKTLLPIFKNNEKIAFLLLIYSFNLILTIDDKYFFIMNK